MAECPKGLIRNRAARNPSNCQFRYTRLWNSLIAHLKKNVEVKKRRHNFRQYENCFTGSDAVEILLNFLLGDDLPFGDEITREKAVKLCQALMDSNIFESVNGEKGHFEDSCSRFFRFGASNDYIGCHAPRDPETLSNCASPKVVPNPVDKMRIRPSIMPDLLDSENIISNPIMTDGKGRILQELFHNFRLKVQHSNHHHHHSDTVLADKSNTDALNGKQAGADGTTGASSIRKSYSLRTKKKPSPRRLNQTISNERIRDIWRETFLSQLLALIYLPFIDSLLSFEGEETAFAGVVIANKESADLNVSSRGCEDPFIRAAYDCLEYHPRGLQIINNFILDLLKLESVREVDFNSNDMLEGKLQLFEYIREYYCNLSDSLLPAKLSDVHTAILAQIDNRKDAVAAEALRLYVLLLPGSSRDQLKRLIYFMRVASRRRRPRLSTEMDNRSFMLKLFSTAIVSPKSLSGARFEHFVLFMMEYAEKIFTPPNDVNHHVRCQVMSLSLGKDASPPSKAYCRQMSSAEHSKETERATSKALVDLMNSIIDDTAFTYKQKEEKLNEFRKFHPKLYDTHFGSLV